MSIITNFDFNFGRSGSTSSTYINDEKFRSIEYIDGWQEANNKIHPENYNNVQDVIVKGRGNYLRTCLETNFTQNTITNRANSYPYCFSNDTNVESTVTTGGSTGKWHRLPRFNAQGQPSVNGVKVGFQKYVCPKHSEAVWPSDHWSLEQTLSNSNWPTRPSNGDGAQIQYSPPKPYHARIRIKLTDFKWLLKSATGVINEYRNILEDENITATSDARINGEIVLVTKIRGFLSLINPDGTNANTNSTGRTTWPHNFNQIYYRVTTDEFGGDANTPLITIMNSECAGNANISGQVNRSSIFYGDSVPFEVPVMPGQKYLIFDIYTDVCDNSQTTPSTQWWQMTWSFESCMYRPVENAGDAPTFFVETNPPLTSSAVEHSYGFPRTEYYFYWDITHGLNTKNISLELYDIHEGESAPVKCEADAIVIDDNKVRILLRTNGPNQELPLAKFKAFLIGGNKII